MDLPLSHGQRAFWFLDRLAPGNAAYVVAGAVRVRGGLDGGALRRSLCRLAERHAALRTTFHEGSEGPVQRVHERLAPDIAVVDGSGWDEEELARCLSEYAYRPFDLARGPLVRLGLFERRDEERLLVLALHHIVSDFWSLGLLVRELGALYGEETGGEAAELAPLTLTYGDWVRAQEERLAGAEGERLWEYWREALQGAPLVLELPGDRPRPARQGFRGEAVELCLGGEKAKLLGRLGRDHGATLAMTLLAGFGALLGRWAGQERVLVGMPTTGRRSREVAGVVGYLVNPVAVEIDLRGDAGFGELVERVRDKARGAFEHQDFPLPLLAERLQPERDPSRPPVFQVAAVLQKGRRSGEDGIAALWAGAAGAQVPFGPLVPESVALRDPGAQFDLTLGLAEWRGELVGRIQYDRDLYDGATVRRLAAQLERLLGAALAAPEARVSELPLLGEGERQQVVVEWNEMGWAAPDRGLLHAGFLERARRDPGAVALIVGERRLDYGELAARSLRLAARLRSLGVGPEVRVGVLCERVVELVVGLLGVLSAGGAYVPLDPAYPAERLELMLADSGAGLVLTRPALRPLLRGWQGRLEELDEAGPAPGAVSAPAEGLVPDHLAYVIYTSGSTGRPKGAGISHGAAAALMRWALGRFAPAELAGTLAATSVCFDLSVFELFAPLWAGGAVILADNVLALPGLAAAREVTLVNTVPSAMAALVESGGLPAGVRTVNLAGEPLRRRLVEEIYRAGAGVERVWNLYGPTEDTTYSTEQRVAVDGREPAIGRPLAGGRACVLDRRGRPVPPGIPGELCLGGAGLARGYLGRGDLTAERFVPDAWSGPAGARLYRTGDLVRQRADGALVYLGRLDHQVKVRGFRIELGEIEAALRSAAGVREAVVVVGDEGEGALLACVAGDGLAAEELRSGLVSRLPAHMVPASIAVLPALPRLPNGKVDRRALAGLARPAAGAGAGEAPVTPTEKALAALWRDLLRVERVGRGDHFFRLGGHSLLAARLAARLREAFGVELGVARLFEAPTLAALAVAIDRERGEGWTAAPLPPIPPLPAAERARPLSLSFAQERLWFLEQLEPGGAIYNMPGGLRLRGDLHTAALEAALAALVARHEALRTGFRADEAGRPVQVIAVIALGAAVALPRVDLSGLGDRREGALRELAQDEAARPFDLARPPLLRALLVRLGPADHGLLVTLHHLVSDGASLGVVGRELAALYGAARAGTAPALPPLPVQYADFAAWQRRTETGGQELARQLEFWRGRLAGLPEALELPADLPRPAVQSTRGGQLPVRLGTPLSRAVRELAQREGATPFMVLLAAFAALLSRLTGQRDLAVGTPVAGRTRRETEELVGLFVNTLVLRCSLEGDPAFRDLVARSRRTLLDATAHQDLPFEKLVEALAPERDRSRPPLVQVVLAHQGSPLAGLALPGLECAPLPVENGTAKFDLTLSLDESEDGELAGYLEYCSDLFHRATARRFLVQLERSLAAAVADPGLKVSELPLLGEGERQQVLVEWNDTEPTAGEEATALAQFEAWARRAPEAPAVGTPERVWSYGELDARAAELAGRLRALGAGEGQVVGICLERSPELVAAVVAVGKTGAAYLPLDPAHPAERLGWQLGDAGVRVLVTEEDRPGIAPVAVATLTPRPPLPGGCKGDGRGGQGVRGLAYVIYTSGSTGRPKGTLLGQRGLANLVAWHRRAYGLSPASRTTLIAGVGFDASVWEMWPALASGASLWIPPAEVVSSPPALAAWLAEQEITCSFLPTPLAEAVLEDGLPSAHRLQFLLTGGDRLHRSAPAGSRFRLVNHYGPTESTVVSTCWDVPAGSAGAPPIGRPISGLRALLLDRTLQPVPPGISGELYVGGEGLAWGYLGRPDLTAASFLPDPFGESTAGHRARSGDGVTSCTGPRLYRTGDLARLRPDGCLEFLGRADQQVKVRGYRIELGEIEAVLASHPDLREAAGLVWGEGRDARLAAYVVPRPHAAVAADALRAWLGERLPAALVPSGWVLLDTLPLTPNGKVDRRALAQLERPAADPGAAWQAPATPAEQVLAAIWSDLLGVERVGRADHFFHLGGHSLLVARLASRIRDAFGVELGVARVFESPTLAALAAEVAAARGAGSSAAPPLTPRPREGALAASFAQERLWFLDQLEPGNAAYNIAGGMRLTGALDAAALAGGFARIVERHEALRTTFAVSDGRPVQVIAPPGSLVPALPLIDLAGLPAAARGPEAERLAGETAARPFDLARGPLLRCALLRLGQEEHRLLLALHHVVGDGWSLGVLVRELGDSYRAGRAGTGEPAHLPPLPVQYADFAAWQREWLSGPELERQLGHWRDRLAGAPAALDLPADRPRPPVQSHAGAHLPVVLPAALRAGLEAVARRGGATPFMVLLAAFDVLLLRATGQEDLVVGSPAASRTRRETEDLIGFFVNTLALRTDLSGDPTFGAALARVRETVLAGFAHQELPFEKLVEALAPERDRSRSPLFQVMLAFQPSPLAGLALPGLAAEPVPSRLDFAKFDLTLSLEEGNDRRGGLAGDLEYCRDLFDRATAERLLDRLRVLLEAVAARPDGEDVRLSELPALSPAERRQLVEWNATAVRYFADPEGELLLHQLIARQVARTPEAPAVTFGGAALSYRELWNRAGQLAGRLAAAGAGPEVRVGICAERSLEMVVGLLAILRAGAAYVPLDPSYPADRLAYMLADSSVPLLLAQRAVAAALPAMGPRAGAVGAAPRVLWLDDVAGAGLDLPEDLARPHPDGLAYVIYTSGSTGRPKGAMNSHRAIVNRLLWIQAEHPLGAADRVLQKTPFSFDVSVWEFFWPLLAGACLVVARPGEHREPAALLATIQAHGVTTVHFVPSMLQLFLEAPGVERCATLRRVMASGEALPYDLQQRFFDRLGGRLGETGARLYNLYGPTEAAVEVTYWPCDPAGRPGVVPIGRPVANTAIHLLDRHLHPVPLGSAGELFIGGVQVARGYLGRPDLTAERFVPDPLSGKPGVRLYRTGDLARRLPGGEVEYLGRLDYQVKVRGFRIELGEIEAALLEQPGVREAVVVARPEAGGARLVAYLVAPEAAPELPDALRAALGRRLPDYMVPSALVLLPALPLSPNGKVDRKALPEPGESDERAAASGVAPATPTEELLAVIWSDLLGDGRSGRSGRVGRDDHFFHLGGHSLLAARVVSRVREALGVELALARLFEAPTLAGMARAIEEARGSGSGLPAIVPLPRPAGEPAELPLSPAQERLWFLDQLESGQALYNMPAAVRLRGPLDRAALAAALAGVVARHETLRTRFASRRGAPVQVIAPALEIPLPVVDLAAAPRSVESLVEAAARAEAERPFDLAVGPLLRATLLRTAADVSDQAGDQASDLAGEHVLLLTFHHIIADGWSMGILIRELAALYGEQIRKDPDRGSDRGPAGLPALPVQFGDFAVAQRAWLAGPELERQLAYWRGRLAGLPPVLELPADRPRPVVPSFRGAHLPVRLGRGLAAAVRAFSHARSATPFMTLLAAFQALLGRWTGRDDLAVGSPIAGRTRAEIEGLIGFFVNTLVLRLDVSGEAGSPIAPGLSGLVARAREAVLGAAAHQDVPFDRLVEELRPERDASNSPLVQVMFAFQNLPAADLRLPGLELERLAVYPERAKLDLSLSLSEVDGGVGGVGGLAGMLELSRDLFDVPTAARLAGHLERLLGAALADPDRPFSELPLLTPAETHQLLVEWHSGAGWQGAETPVVVSALFAEQAACTPEVAALVRAGEEGPELVTYRELAAWSGRIARRLRERGVGPDVLVGVCLERSFTLVAGLLGIFEAGGGYVPLDLALPPDRLRFLVADSGLRIVVTRRALAEAARAVAGETGLLDGLDVVLIDDLEHGLEHGLEQGGPGSPAAGAPGPVDPRSIAYVIYTSGSTGRPKGVAVPHGALGQRMRFARDAERWPEERYLFKAALSFDASVGEIFYSLVGGATVVVVRPDGERDTRYLIRLIRELGVHHVGFTPTPLMALLDEPEFAACRSLRRVYTGGEAVPADLPARVWERLSGDLYNRYGPTEATISIMAYRCDPGRRERVVPIGRPIAGTRVHLLDRAFQPVPMGVPGELCLGGGCLARGYLGRPDLTAAGFVPDPFAGEGNGGPGTRLYRTGDLARFRPDGNLEFLGRIDQQVKVRGFRIELGEVETVLAEHPGVQDAVAGVHQDGDGPAGRRLVAFVVPREPGALTAGQLAEHLTGRVPAYMVPAAFVLLDELPLLPSGKADRQRLLQQVEPGGRARAPFEAPTTPTEEMLAEIWGEVLEIPPAEISIRDQFFDLGGHSLQITRVLNRVHEAFGVEITIRAFFETPTLAGLGQAVAEALTAQVDDERLAELLSEL